MPFCGVPAADPFTVTALDEVALPFVSEAKVYLSRIVELPPPPEDEYPIANIPTVPTPPPVDAPNPNPCADAAPCVKIVGIRYPHLYWV